MSLKFKFRLFFFGAFIFCYTLFVSAQGQKTQDTLAHNQDSLAHNVALKDSDTVLNEEERYLLDSLISEIVDDSVFIQKDELLEDVASSIKIDSAGLYEAVIVPQPPKIADKDPKKPNTLDTPVLVTYDKNDELKKGKKSPLKQSLFEYDAEPDDADDKKKNEGQGSAKTTRDKKNTPPQKMFDIFDTDNFYDNSKVGSINFKKEFFKTYYKPQYLKDIVHSFSNSVFQGRVMGSRGQRMALAFLNYELEKNGYKGLYNGSLLQTLKISESEIQKMTFEYQNKTYSYPEDFHTDFISGTMPLSTYNLIFIGKATKPEEIINALHKYYKDNKRNALFVSPSNIFDINAFYKVLSHIQEHYKLDMIVCLNNIQTELERVDLETNKYFKSSRSKLLLSVEHPFYKKYGLPILFVTNKFFVDVYGKQLPLMKYKEFIHQNKGNINYLNVKPVDITFGVSVKKTNKYTVGNLVGVAQGYDPKKENIIISANYDGNGLGTGVNYNATGVASVLSLSKIFAQISKKHSCRKNLIFVFWIGHFRGNVGSDFYAKFPLFPHSKTFLNINLNGLGIKNKSRGDKFFYALTSTNHLRNFSSFINNINEHCGNYNLDLSLNKSLAYKFRSDGWQFGQLGIPFIEFTDLNLPLTEKAIFDNLGSVNFSTLNNRVEYLSKFIWHAMNSNMNAYDLVDQRQLFKVIQDRTK